MFKFCLSCFIFIILSSCGTYHRIMDTFPITEQGKSFYNPYNPYYQAVRNDLLMVSFVCGMPIMMLIDPDRLEDLAGLPLTIIGCSFSLIDESINFIADTYILPYDVIRGAFIKHYNKKHIVYEYYGPFIVEYSSIYKTGNFLTIYFLTLNDPLTSPPLINSHNKRKAEPIILSFQAKLVDKRLTPTPRLLVKNRFGVVFSIEVNSFNQITIKRVGDSTGTVLY